MKYRIDCGVKSARGWQSFTVEAGSKEEALRKHAEGESEYLDEEVEVTELEKPQVFEAE